MNGYSLDGLKAFHEDQVLLLLAHSAEHLKKIRALLGKADHVTPRKLYDDYIRTFMSGLLRKPTVSKQLRVFRIIEKHFKKQLSEIERRELFDAAWAYKRGEIPLIVPLTLLKHLAVKYNDNRMKHQSHLNPHPAELMLRNHV